MFHLFEDILDSSPHPHANPSYPNPTNETLGLNKYQKGGFTSSTTIAFHQKSILIFEIQLQIGYLNLWDIFRFISRQLRMIFFHKIMVTEKNNFFSNA